MFNKKWTLTFSVVSQTLQEMCNVLKDSIRFQVS